MKGLEKELENTIHLFEDRNVSELKTNGDTACYLKSVQLYLWIFPSETRDIQIGSKTIDDANFSVF